MCADTCRYLALWVFYRSMKIHKTVDELALVIYIKYIPLSSFFSVFCFLHFFKGTILWMCMTCEVKAHIKTVTEHCGSHCMCGSCGKINILGWRGTQAGLETICAEAIIRELHLYFHILLNFQERWGKEANWIMLVKRPHFKMGKNAFSKWTLKKEKRR